MSCMGLLGGEVILMKISLDGMESYLNEECRVCKDKLAVGEYR